MTNPILEAMYEEFKAGKSDHKFVNFSQDHELNRHLRRVDKSQSYVNRKILKDEMQYEAKKELGKASSDNITHGEFHQYISKEENLERLEDKK